MAQFTGQKIQHFSVFFPDAIWEMVSSDEWQSKFYSFDSKNHFAKWIASQDSSTDFSKIDGFYNVEGAEQITVKPYLEQIDIY